MNPGLLMGAWMAIAQAGVVRGAPPPPTQSTAPRRVALLVGIDDYTDPRLGGLRFAAKDAHDLAEVLGDPDLGAFDSVRVLSGEVNAGAFWSAYADVTAHLRRDDTFLLFLAAHGTLALDQGTALYVLPSDASLQSVSETGIPMDEVQRRISELPSRRRALVLDTCHSGTGRSVIPPETAERISRLRGPPPAPTALAISQSEVRMYSAHFNQPALEDAALGNGVYTHFLLRALRGHGDLDGDGLIEAAEAHAFARDATLAHTGGEQVPWMETQTIGREEVFLAGDASQRGRAERAMLVGLARLPQHAQISVDGNTRGITSLEPGTHRVVVEVDGDVVLDQRVRLKRGQELDLDRLVRARSGAWWLEAGGEWTQRSDWTADGGAQLGAWWMPKDRGGLRGAFGAEATMGIGDLPSGQVLARAGLWAGDAVVFGPVVGLGAFWRIRDGERQGAPLVSPGATVRIGGPRLKVALTPSLLLFETDEGLQMETRVGAGVAWSP